MIKKISKTFSPVLIGTSDRIYQYRMGVTVYDK